ncbi:hypothetical protein [Arthrobacter rhombi]|uniref:hypothetical protein n=1 Tax=Arthrobacter rhombi TaxID=71253 RepID=UPI001177A449|nr:hypothetical protein [Arthrobacter rhombi]
MMEALRERFVIKIGCTGRDTHKRAILGSFYVLGDLEEGEGETKMPSNKDLHNFTDGEDYAFVKPLRAPEGHFDPSKGIHKTYPFKCPKCGRDVPMGQIRLWRSLRQLKAAGLHFLDLSSLDAIG